MEDKYRIGLGYDIHKIQPGTDGLWIGGCRLSDKFVFVAHSDGDILIHALIDSLLGAAGEPDIGQLFPDDDSRYRNIRSSRLLNEVRQRLSDRRIRIVNIDAVIVGERMRISPFKDRIRREICRLLEIEPHRFNLKAKTREGVGAVGRGEAMECYCTSLIMPATPTDG